MSDKQQDGSNMTSTNDGSKQSPPLKKTERISLIKQDPTTMMSKPSWQIARDISMEILSRKSTKLILKQGSPTPSLNRQRSVARKYSLHGTPSPSKASQLYRIPRMPTEHEADLIGIAYKLLCSFCEGPCIGDYVRCRVCNGTYHSRCLFLRGHVNNPLFSLPRLAKQDWNCPECCQLTRLLTQDELHHLIHAFEQIDQNKDGYIILEEFLSLQTNKTTPKGFELFIQYNHDLGKKHFKLMDSSENGVVAWSDFALFYSCKLIAVKDEIELSMKLTEQELVMARNLFFKDPRKTFDNERNIIITREHFNRVHDDLIVLLKKKYGNDFVDAVLSYDHSSEDTSEKFSIMNWGEFIRELALLILLNRHNDAALCGEARRAKIPPHLSNESKLLRPITPIVEVDSSKKFTLTRSYTPATPILPNISCDESFRKHAKLLEKLNQQNRQEEIRKKQMGSSISFTILESTHEEENINLPKLKLNARDDRKSIIDPWTAVNEMQQLRNEPILIKTTRLRTLKT